MLCAISGTAPQVPVASLKSGNVFEKRLIEDYISQNHKDPVTGEDLEIADLIELKTARVVRPRPPTLTSIPSLLSTFQNEWDAIALETYTLKQQLAQTRQELSTALYEYEGALRVIAKINKERDEARDALSKVTVSAGGASGAGGNGDAMQVDGQGLPEEVAAKVEATQQRLFGGRRKRPVPDGWATSDDIEAFEAVHHTESIYPGSKSLVVDESGDLALFGGADGVAGVFSFSKKTTVHALKCGSSVTDVIWWDTRQVVATSSGAIKIFENGKEFAQLGPHAGACTGVALHPSNEILASVGVDKSYMLYDLINMKLLTRVFTESELTCGSFHPDGHLFAAGATDGEIKVFDVSSGTIAATFTSTGPIRALSFSENGTWLASVVKGQSTVSIWDLRKSAVIKEIDIGSEVVSVNWEYTGQFLAVAGPGCVAVQQYDKRLKVWSEKLRKAVPAAAVAWGKDARSLVAVTAEGGIEVLGSA